MAANRPSGDAFKPSKSTLSSTKGQAAALGSDACQRAALALSASEVGR